MMEAEIAENPIHQTHSLHGLCLICHTMMWEPRFACRRFARQSSVFAEELCNSPLSQSHCSSSIPWEGTMTGGTSSVTTAHCRHACKFQLETLITVERQTATTEVTSISALRYSADKELPLNVSLSSVQMR